MDDSVGAEMSTHYRIARAASHRMAVAVTFTTLGLASAGAQRPLPDFDRGQRVRLAPLLGPMVTGNVFYSTADSIVVVGPESLYVQRSRLDLRRIQRSAGRSRTTGSRKGMQYGLVAAGVMGIIGGVPHRRPDQSPRADAALETFFGTLLVTLPIGALVGAVIGSERWETWWEIYPDGNPRKAREKRHRRGELLNQRWKP